EPTRARHYAAGRHVRLVEDGRAVPCRPHFQPPCRGGAYSGVLGESSSRLHALFHSLLRVRSPRRGADQAGGRRDDGPAGRRAGKTEGGAETRADGPPDAAPYGDAYTLR